MHIIVKTVEDIIYFIKCSIHNILYNMTKTSYYDVCMCDIDIKNNKNSLENDTHILTFCTNFIKKINRQHEMNYNDFRYLLNFDSFWN